MNDARIGWYVYCVVAPEARPELEGVAGVDPDSGPTLLAHGDVSAVVSRVRLDEFGADALKRNLEDLGWLERTARAHDAVLARALAGEAVVPMRLCTIFTDEAHVRDMLELERDRLARALELLRGRAEWGVKVLADLGALEAAARERTPALAAAGSESGGAGRAYFAHKKADQALRQEARSMAAAAAEETHTRLRDPAVAATLLPAQHPDLSRRSGEMVLNGAYLVDRSRGPAFEAIAEELAERHRPAGIQLELSGPWAPYNFVPEGREPP